MNTTTTAAPRASRTGGGTSRPAGQTRASAPRRRTAYRRNQFATWLFIAPAVIYIAVFFAIPVFNNVIISFQEYTTRTFYTGEAPWVGFDNYAEILSSGLFARLTWNTAVFTVVSLASTFVIGLGLALFFNKSFRLSAVLRSLILLPWLLPLVISSAIWRRMMDEGSGIINVILRAVGLDAVPWLTSPDIALVSIIIVNVWIGIPFVMVILYGGLQEIPREFFEAASLDGATGWRGFRHITWPLLQPVVIVVLTLGFIYTIRVLDIVLALTGGGPANATQTYASQAYQLSFVGFEFGLGAALSNILIVVSLLIAALQLISARRPNDMAG